MVFTGGRCSDVRTCGTHFLSHSPCQSSDSSRPAVIWARPQAKAGVSQITQYLCLTRSCTAASVSYGKWKMALHLYSAILVSRTTHSALHCMLHSPFHNTALEPVIYSFTAQGSSVGSASCPRTLQQGNLGVERPTFWSVNDMLSLLNPNVETADETNDSSETTVKIILAVENAAQVNRGVS